MHKITLTSVPIRYKFANYIGKQLLRTKRQDKIIYPALNVKHFLTAQFYILILLFLNPVLNYFQ